MNKYLTSILSIPFGPKEVLNKFATVLAAVMFAYTIIRSGSKRKGDVYVKVEVYMYLVGF